MEKVDGFINLFNAVPENIKNKLSKLSKEELLLKGKIELVVLVGEGEEEAKNQVVKIGGSYESLGYGYAIVAIDTLDIEKLLNIKNIIYAELPKTLYTSFIESNRAACITEAVQSYNLSGEGVVIGFIDSGIDYTHPAFIDDAGFTRIEYIYELFSNKLWSKEDINRALKSKDPYLVVPEKDDLGHGTHVAGIAAGGGKIDKRYYGVAFKSTIIMVKMTAPGKINYAQSTQLMRGIKFLVDKGRELNKPLAINLSFSTNDGAHDGSSLLEKYISTVCSLERISFIAAAGNDADKGHHVGGILRPSQTISFNIAEDETALIFQMYKDLIPDLTIEIKNPSGESSGKIAIQRGLISGKIGTTNYYVYYSGPKPFSLNGEIIISIVPSGSFILSGQWSIQIDTSSPGTNYDIWMPIAEGLNPLTRFLQPNTNNTLGIPATTDNVISVGSYNSNYNTISAFSGRGSVNSDMPNVVAPGEAIEAAIPEGGFDALTGTSMAAPHLSGSAALLMEWGIVKGNDVYMYGDRLKYYILKGARRNRQEVNYPNNIWGYGTLCVKNALDLAAIHRESRKLKGEVKSMEYRELKENCGELYIKDNFKNVIVEYDGDIIGTLKNVPDACAFVLDENYGIVSADEKKIEEIIKTTKEIVYVEESSLYTLCAISPIDAANISNFHSGGYLTLRGQGVLVGILDTGIDYLNDELIYEDDSTKIVSLWDQTETKGVPPKGFNLGAQYNSEMINNAIKEKRKGGDPYKIVPSKDLSGHGTKMAVIIGGRGKKVVGGAPDCELVVVKLKEAKKNTLENKGITNPKCEVYESTDIILGIKYLFEAAKRLNKPMVIYIPISSNEGSHSGSSIIERFINDISKTRGIAVVTGCGNEGDSDTHTTGVISKAGDIKTIELKVDPFQKDLSFQIWANKPDKISLGIVSPSGEVIEKINAKLKEVEEIKFVFENSMVYVRYYLPEEVTGDELISVTINNIKPGIWQFKLIGDYIVDGRYNAWLPQRALLKEETRFLSPNQFTTLTLPSTSREVICCSYYNQDNNTIVSASGRGYTRDDRIKPDVTCGGVNVQTVGLSGEIETVSGSSAATAVLASAVALLLQWGIVQGNDPTMYSTKIKAYLIRGTTKRPGEVYPNPTWGYGILNLQGVFENLRGLSSFSTGDIFIRVPKELMWIGTI